jgi:hypothetical protein
MAHIVMACYTDSTRFCLAHDMAIFAVFPALAVLVTFQPTTFKFSLIFCHALLVAYGLYCRLDGEFKHFKYIQAVVVADAFITSLLWFIFLTRVYPFYSIDETSVYFSIACVFYFFALGLIALFVDTARLIRLTDESSRIRVRLGNGTIGTIHIDEFDPATMQKL